MRFQEFYLRREVDDSGVSGTGIVAHGVILKSGQCILEWITTHVSFGVYPSLKELHDIHSHGGHTKIFLIKSIERAILEEEYIP
jgi:hypothetical protein